MSTRLKASTAWVTMFLQFSSVDGRILTPTAGNNQTTAGLGFTFNFDFNGNRLTRTETATGKVQSYEWDYRNRLTAVIDRNTAGGAIVKRVDYNYDPYNRLVKRSLHADGAGPNPATTQ
ncbi:MAG: hypothetical protein GYA66_12585, partial [Phyllobacteriaceae bacterium]|nr:hypothetical protein [Phyllobacteriaceae bacterium]